VCSHMEFTTYVWTLDYHYSTLLHRVATHNDSIWIKNPYPTTIQMSMLFA